MKINIYMRNNKDNSYTLTEVYVERSKNDNSVLDREWMLASNAMWKILASFKYLQSLCLQLPNPNLFNVMSTFV
jgi:hypothetical protein